jgi:hypothetical protein
VLDARANTWHAVAGAARTFPELYPSRHLLPSGHISRSGWAQADMAVIQTAYLPLTGALSGVWTSLPQQLFFDRQEGMAVMMIDDTVSPPATQVLVVGGGAYGPPTTRNPQSVETIDLTQLAPPPAWTRTADMSFARTNVNAVLVPDATVFVVGGPASVAPGALGCGPPAGLCDCDCKSAGRRVLAPSAAILERVVTFWRGGS